MIGRTLSRYHILAKLGEGGMGVVYKAQDQRLGREVALKLLPPAALTDALALRRLRQEAAILSKLNHPNITTIYDFETVDDVAFLVMELVHGQTLQGLLVAGAVEQGTIFGWGEQLAAGLAAAHNLGIVHRDLKPGNVLITLEGRLKILDFGLATLVGTALSPTELTLIRSQEGAVSGTLPYMAPEQFASGSVGAGADIHAAGAILYELSTGRRPFLGDSVAELIHAILNLPPPTPRSLNPRIRPEMEEIILRCLEKQPEQRYRSAQALSDDLRRVGGAVPLEREGSIGVPHEEPPRRTRLKSIALLPLKNATGAAKYAYLSIALPDVIALVLTRSNSLHVRPLSSTQKFSGIDPRTAGQELRVDVVLAGHFLADKSHVYVTLQAIEVESDQLLWTTRVRAPREALEQFESGITSEIETELLPALGVRVTESLLGTRPGNAEAYALYLRAVGTSLDAAPNESAIELLKRVVELDPRFAPGWSALARRYLEHASFGRGGAESYELSERAYQRALALDPKLIDAASGLVVHWTEKGELTAAWDVARELLARQPDALVSHVCMAYVLRFGGLHRESARHCERGLEINHDPRLGHGALTFLALEEYEGTERFLTLRAGTAWADNIRMFVDLHRGRASEALKTSKRLLADPAYPAMFVAAFLENRPESEVASFADQFVEQNARLLRDPESSFLDATLMSYCGQVERSLRLLRTAIRGGYCSYPNLETDPLMENVRRSAEYPALLSEARARHEAFVSYLDLAASPPME